MKNLKLSNIDPFKKKLGGVKPPRAPMQAAGLNIVQSRPQMQNLGA
jgi:hypothetical protein